jgi:disulfide bond formation protein DsbB
MNPTPRAFAGVVLIASAVVLGAALLSQYWGGLAPCELCLLQRWPWRAAILVSLIALVFGSRAAQPWVSLGLAAVFVIGAGLAFYHVGVEQKWFAGPAACTASQGAATTIEEMKRQIMGTAPVLCDKVQWSLFGVSLAGWNFLASLGMAAVCLFAFARSRRAGSRSPVAV